MPRPPAVATALPASRNAAGQAFLDILDWLWGTIQGDFNRDQTIGQTAVNTIVGLIPIADQVLDVRDLIAGMKYLIEYYMEDEDQRRAYPESLGLSYETWLWIGLFLIAIGCIPELGSAVKGVLKSMIRSLQDASRAAGGLSAQELRKIWETLLAVLNYLGVHQGNAHRWLAELPGRLGGYLDDAARRIRDAAGVLAQFFDEAAGYARKLGNWRVVDQAWVRRTLDTIERAKRALAEMLDRLEHQKKIINDWLGEQLNRVLGARGTSGGVGSVNTHPPGAAGAKPASGSNQAVQKAEPPREPALPHKLSTAERMDDLRRQGHGPGRHEGQVTHKDLENRVLDGTDPMTGSNINPKTGEPYTPPRTASRITSEKVYVEAEARMRASQEFSDATIVTLPNGQRQKTVDLPLARAIGNDYRDQVEGVTRIGSIKHPAGIQPTDFQGGQMSAIYRENSQGGWDLLTMYPEPAKR